MKEQFICEILHYLPSFTADHQEAVKHNHKRYMNF